MAWVKCVSCGAALQAAAFQQGSGECGLCHKRQDVRLLPALFSNAAKPPLLPVAPQPGDMVCFFDENRKATQSCSHCGIFMSDAWSAKWGLQTVCLKCLDELRTKSSDARFQTQRTLWDNIALGFSFGPWVLLVLFLCTLVLYFFGIFSVILTLITAPAAIFVALRYWNAPRSLAPRGHGRLVLAILFALLQLAGWVAGVVALAYNWSALE